MFEIPPEWNAVPDLIMKDKEGMMITETDTKWKRDKVAQGRRKQLKEDNICPEKCEHSPRISRRTQNQAGFYSENWDELQQEEDEWQKISQMVFHDGGLEIIPNEAGCNLSSCTQHQGGGCSVSVA